METIWIMNKTNSKVDIKAISGFLLTLLWMGLIFFFSSQPAVESARESTLVVGGLHDLVKWLYNGRIPPSLAESILRSDHVVRKCGHVLEYAILGILVFKLVSRLGFRKRLVVSTAVCMLYAASDEIHQIFVPGRGPGVLDVLLDTAAAAAGIIIVLMIKRQLRFMRN